MSCKFVFDISTELYEWIDKHDYCQIKLPITGWTVYAYHHTNKKSPVEINPSYGGTVYVHENSTKEPCVLTKECMNTEGRWEQILEKASVIEKVFTELNNMFLQEKEKSKIKSELDEYQRIKEIIPGISNILACHKTPKMEEE